MLLFVGKFKQFRNLFVKAEIVMQTSYYQHGLLI